VFLGDRRVPASFSREHVDFAFSRLPTVRPAVRILWEQAFSPLECLSRRLDVFHSTAYVLPLICPTRSVVTVHDLTFMLMPEAFRRGNRAYLTTMTRLAVHRADRVIAVSESTKRDVVRLLGVPESKVTVIYHGIEPEFRPLPPDEVAAFRTRHGLPDRYALYVGTLEPRKNLPNLLRAYALARSKRGVTAPLVLGGGKGWGYESIFQLVEELGLRDSVRLPGYLPLADLPLWYNGASLFVYPSRYEGFGMPALEAMACGAPVLTTRASSLPEVVGDAGLLVGPDDVEGMADAIAAVLNGGTLGERLRSDGLGRAGGFSWAEAAKQTVAVYRELGRPPAHTGGLDGD
jgi:glycosyltransferase involved in cell wall biosynthesis